MISNSYRYHLIPNFIISEDMQQYQIIDYILSIVNPFKLGEK